jgi:ABC-type transport system involved in multi-copper enzyme maturation permease subunit
MSFPDHLDPRPEERGVSLRPSSSWRTRAALLVIAILFATAAPWMPWAIRGTLLGVGAAPIASAMMRAGGFRVVGPLFWFDLARLARRGRTALLRVTYALLLLACLIFFFYQRFSRHFTEFGTLFGEGPRLPMQQWGQFARYFVVMALTLQAGFVIAVTPAYLAGAVAEEKERGTLKLLFTTPLLDREIVLGKLLGRLTHLATVILAGLPILSLIPIWGGVESQLLLAGFAVTGLGLLSTGGLSILCSVLARNVLGAVLSSYGLVLLFNWMCLAMQWGSPVTFTLNFEQRYTNELRQWQRRADDLRRRWLDEIEGGRLVLGPSYRPPPAPAMPPAPDPNRHLLQMLAGSTVQHGVVFMACTLTAVACLRSYGGAPHSARPARAPRTPPPRSRPTKVDRPVAVRRVVVLAERGWGPAERPALKRQESVLEWVPSTRPRVTDGALLWKELYGGTIVAPQPPPLKELLHSPGMAMILLISLALLFLHGLAGAHLAPPFVLGLSYLFRVGTLILGGIWCVGLAFRTAVSVCKEREQRTLEGLLLLPVERMEILRAKWLGSVLRGRFFAYGLGVLWLAGLVSGVLHPWAVLLLAGGVTVCVIFLASLGIWLSLASRNTLWANLTMALFLLLLFGGSVIRANVDLLSAYRPTATPTWLETFADVGLSPLRAWWVSCFSWYEVVNGIRNKDVVFSNRVTAIMAGQAILGVAAWVLWRLACVRFRRESAQRPSAEAPHPAGD